MLNFKNTSKCRVQFSEVTSCIKLLVNTEIRSICFCFFFKIGLGQDRNIAKDEKSLNDVKPAEKPIAATVNEGLEQTENVVRPIEGEVKRQEPPVPHAPQDDPLQKKDNEEPLKNDKRQLMSKEDDKSNNVDNMEEKTNNVNAGIKKAVDAEPIKVSQQEIDEELKKLEQPNKVL